MSENREFANRPTEQTPERVLTVLPPVDIVEDENGIALTADLPGVSKESLGVRVDGDILVIEGQMSVAGPANMQLVYAESRVPNYRRTFTLSRELDTGKIDAQLKDGVLKVRIPKVEEAKPLRIEVKVA